jgi:hypothetical protein
MTAMAKPLQLDEDMLAQIVRYAPEDIPEMIEITRRAELTCVEGVSDLHRRIRERTRDQSGERMNIIVYSQAIRGCDSKIRWLQDVRSYLTAELERQGNVSALVG